MTNPRNDRIKLGKELFKLATKVLADEISRLDYVYSVLLQSDIDNKFKSGRQLDAEAKEAEIANMIAELVDHKSWMDSDIRVISSQLKKQAIEVQEAAIAQLAANFSKYQSQINEIKYNNGSQLEEQAT